MGVIRSAFSLGKAILFVFIGNTDEITRWIYRNNPRAIMSKYDDIINQKTGSVNQFVETLASMIAINKRRVGELSNVNEQIADHDRVKKGALAMAQQRKDELKAKGKTDEEIMADTKVMKAMAGYRDASSTLTQLTKRSAELEASINQSQSEIERHKVRLQSFQREVDRLKLEKHETVARIISAEEQNKLNKMSASLATDTTSKDLEDVRNLRDQVIAEAEVTGELSGASAEAVKDDFLRYAEKSEADKEFADLLGLKTGPVKEEVAARPVGETAGKLPE